MTSYQYTKAALLSKLTSELDILGIKPYYMEGSDNSLIISYVMPLSVDNKKALDQAVEAHTTTPTNIELAKARINDALRFGGELFIQFCAENVLMGITQKGKTELVLENMSAINKSIKNASLYETVRLLKSFPNDKKDDEFITNARLLKFLNKVEEYLKLPISTELEE